MTKTALETLRSEIVKKLNEALDDDDENLSEVNDSLFFAISVVVREFADFIKSFEIARPQGNTITITLVDANIKTGEVHTSHFTGTKERTMSKCYDIEEIDIFRNQRVASQEGQAVMDHLNANDGTAGHSKGVWGYYGDTIVGLHTDCQHSLDITKHGTNYEHEADDLIPWMDEQIFDDSTAKIDTTWDEYRSNLRLMALAQHAPHDCGDPECPGVINKRKLELYDKFQVAINEFAKADLLT